jgi:cardiolipin synthase
MHAIDNTNKFCLRAWFARFLVLLLFHSGVVGCATVPDVDPLIRDAKAADNKPRVVTAKGPLSVKQTQALFKRLGLTAENSDLLKRHLAVEQEIAESPLVAGNSTRLLKDGPQTFSAIFEAIRNAKDHINMEYYILEDVEHEGQKLVDLLIAKRGEGVAINVMFDSFGSFTLQGDMFDRLRKAGVKVLEFNPVNPMEAKVAKSPNDRDHRKIFVADGQVAIVGGVNLSVTYQSSPGKPDPDAKIEHWRDTDLELRGPIVAELQKLFFDQWHKHQGEQFDEANYFPKLAPTGNEVVRVIASTPDNGNTRYYTTLLSAIRSAEKSIWITNSYFVPTDDLKNDIMDAAKRGVDVRLLVPNKTDVKPALAIQRSHYKDLLKAGVKVYENPNVVLHAKSLVIDGVWSVIGSSNLDFRSVLYNDEVDVVVLGPATGSEMQKMFEEDAQDSHQITLKEWKDRPWLQRFNEIFFRLFQNVL